MVYYEIEQVMKKINCFASKLGYPLPRYTIEDSKAYSHEQPKNLPKGKAAVYIFIYRDNNSVEILKIGKANEKSFSRYCSQHFGFNAPSTLAKSICNDIRFINLGINRYNVKEWMLNNLRRINILIDEDKASTELIESILHYKFRPTYEGKIK